MDYVDGSFWIESYTDSYTGVYMAVYQFNNLYVLDWDTHGRIPSYVWECVWDWGEHGLEYGRVPDRVA